MNGGVWIATGLALAVLVTASGCQAVHSASLGSVAPADGGDADAAMNRMPDDHDARDGGPPPKPGDDAKGDDNGRSAGSSGGDGRH